MKNFTNLFGALFIFGVLLFPDSAQASHLKGGDTYIVCVGNGQYELVFACYYACEPTSIGYDTVASDFAWTLTSTCGSVPTSISAVSASPAQDVPLYCRGVMTQCDYFSWALENSTGEPYANAPANAPVGTLVVTYTSAPFTIPPGCTVTSTMYFSARNAAISNLLNASIYGINITSTITVPASGACVSDPQYAQYPVNVFCNGQNANFSQGAIDLNGDSLTYTLINPQDAGGIPIPFVTGCDSSNPMGVGTGAGFASVFTFDTTNGNINFTPTATGDYVLTVRVNAYNNGVLVGSTMRDEQFTVVACNYVDNPPALGSKFTTSDVTGGTVIDSNHIGVCPGEQVTINLTSNDIDSFHYILDSTNVLQALPGSSYIVTHRGTVFDTATLHITWTPTGADSGFHYFLVTTEDTFCPTPGRNTYAFEVSVLQGVDAGPNLVYCNGGSPVTIYASGANHYVWTDSATGGPPRDVISYGPDSSYIIVDPGTAGGVPIGSSVGYVVKGDLLGACKNTDTVSVKNAQPFTLVATALDSTVCKFTTTTLTATPSPGSVGPFTYIWSPADSVVSSTSATTSTTAMLYNTMYRVTATSAGGCAITDSVPITIVGAAPRITITPSTNYVCPGTSIFLSSQVAAENLVSCGATNTLPPNSNPATGYINNTYTSSDTNNSTAPVGLFGNETYCSPFMGSYNSYRAQYLILASELNAAGLSSGTITDFSFFIKTLNSSVPYDTFSVSMGCTNLTSLTDFVNNLQVVIPPQYGTNAPTANVNLFANQWNPQLLTNYFNWDGASNIVIQICYTINPNLGSADDYISYNTTTYTSCVIAGDDQQEGIEGCSLSLNNNDLATFTGVTTLNTRPDFLFHINEPNVLTYSWTPTGTTCDHCDTTTVVVLHDTTYTLTVSDGVCTNSAGIELSLNPGLILDAAPDTTLCGGSDTVQLSVTSASGPYSPCIQAYTVSSIPYSPINGGGITIQPSAFTDVNGVVGSTLNATTGAIPIGFTFPFYCETFDQFYINTNCWISFVNPSPGTTATQMQTAQTLPPAAADLNPQKTVELVKDFYEPADALGNGGGYIDYFVTGTAPNRILVVQFNNIVDGTFGIFSTTGEEHLYEGSGIIDILITSTDMGLNNHTTGIKDSTGLGVAAPGMNNAAYTVSSPVAWRFTPQLGSNSHIIGTAWTPNLYLSDSSIADPLAYPPGVAQTYAVTSTVVINLHTNPSTCTVTDSVTVRFGHTGGSSVSAVPPGICAGDTTQLRLTSPDTITTYSWRPAAGLSDSTIYDPLASVQSTSEYIVRAVNNQGCVLWDTITVTALPLPVVSLPASYTVCDCYPDSIVRPAISGGTPGYTYVWSNGGTDSTNVDTLLNTTSYTVTVTDAGHCTAVSNSQSITMNCPRANITVSPVSDTIFLHDTATLIAVTAPGSVFSYIWTSDSGTILEPASDTTGLIATSGGTETVALTITDQTTNCTYTTTQVVHVVDFGGFVMGNAFTPNGDGMNDFFYPAFNGPNSTAKVQAFRIYDRWGQLIYDNPDAPGWDGNFKGQYQPTGAYLYFITVNYPDPNDPSKTVQKNREGNFMLFR